MFFIYEKQLAITLKEEMYAEFSFAVEGISKIPRNLIYILQFFCTEK